MSQFTVYVTECLDINAINTATVLNIDCRYVFAQLEAITSHLVDSNFVLKLRSVYNEISTEKSFCHVCCLFNYRNFIDNWI